MSKYRQLVNREQHTNTLQNEQRITDYNFATNLSFSTQHHLPGVPHNIQPRRHHRLLEPQDLCAQQSHGIDPDFKSEKVFTMIVSHHHEHLVYIEPSHKHHHVLHLVDDQHEGGLPSHNRNQHKHKSLLIHFRETQLYLIFEYVLQTFVA